MDIECRLAVLEERTHEKPKRLVEHVKEWGGVATLIVAMLYTFPLGVWDRFYLTKEAREAARIETLSNLTMEMANLDAEMAQGFSNIQDVSMKNFFTRSLSSKKLIIINKNLDLIEKYYDQLEPSELAMLGYSLGQAGQIGFGERLLDEALEKLGDENASLKSDLYRLKATMTVNNIEELDINSVRKNFYAAIQYLKRFSSDNAKLQSSNSAYEWAILEMSKGDWACGQEIAKWSIDTISSIPPINPQVNTYLDQYRYSFSQLKKQEWQLDEGCPEGYVIS